MMTIIEPAATVIDKHIEKKEEKAEKVNATNNYNVTESDHDITGSLPNNNGKVATQKLPNVTVAENSKEESDKDQDHELIHEKVDSEKPEKSEELTKPPKKKRKSGFNSGLAKLLEDSMWYIESSGGSRVRESSLRIEKIKEQQIDQMIQEREKEVKEPVLSAEEIAIQERKKALRREQSKQKLEAKRKRQEEQRLRRKQLQEERKKLIAEGKIQPMKKKIPTSNIDLNNIDTDSYYGGGEIAELLKASAYFTNQGKKFDGSRREIKPVERLLEDDEFAADLRRTSKGKSLKHSVNSSNSDKIKTSVKSKKKKSQKVKKTTEVSSFNRESSYPSVENGHTVETDTTVKEETDLKQEIEREKAHAPPPPPEPTWFTDFTEDDVEISENWKFFQDFVYQGTIDTHIPNNIVHAADIIRNTIKIYRTDHEVYKLQKVDLHFPFSEYKEHYLLALPKDDVQFNPFDEIGKLMELMAIAFFPPLEKLKVMNLEQPKDCIIGRYIKGFENNDIEGLLKCITEFNCLIDNLRTTGQILDYTKQRKTFPRELIYEILNQCYLRRVLPESKKLSIYKAFSNEVYGELMPSFLTTVYAKCNLDHNCCFIDLGSGVGNCVIQAALEYGCESHGVEIVENASRLGDLQAEEFELRCRVFGLKPGSVNLFSQQSFVNNPPVKNVVDKCKVILVNNYLFDNPLNKKVIELFQDLKVGTKIISLKPIVPATHKINWDNCSSILNRLKTSKFIYAENSVSWTSNGGFYYITEVMSDIVEDNFVVFKSREARRRDEGLDERSRSDTPLNAFTNNV
ncbi:hypothetical protein PMKS-003838 [Pichia membranifaciens]|uniref:Histone-lysine N-methyltransferase, H3 lysine-79 specific n=1 Tax=Pichia membranifaciens TaxID=4926 RepID=A0A1Q2YL95_9ASCO|nr:hypothetical protein PMKS-003838 [Pichia membranifaciens]